MDKFGLYLGDVWVSNAIPRVLRTFAKPGGDLTAVPDLIEVDFQFEGGRHTTLKLTPSALRVSKLKKALPTLICPPRHAALFEDHVIHLLNQASMPPVQLPDSAHLGLANRGYYFERSGLHVLPDGQTVYVLANQIIGDCRTPCAVSPTLSSYRVQVQNSAPFPALVPLLEAAPPQALLVFVYVLAALLGSYLHEQGLDFQGVLHIVGPSGVGKTELARRMTGWYLDAASNTPALHMDASSTSGGLTAALAAFPNTPLLIDDLCVSTGHRTQQKRMELASDLIHRATNHTSVVKNGPDGASLRQRCAAFLIFTAEFEMAEESELTRCVPVPIKSLEPLSKELSTQLIGDGVVAFLKWLTSHTPQAAGMLHTPPSTNFGEACPFRVTQNLVVLISVYHLLQCAAADAGCNTQRLDQQFTTAVLLTLSAQERALLRFSRSKKRGTLAEIMLDAYNNCEAVFRLAPRLKELEKHDGIIWKGDLCLRRDALERFIHQQPGYQDIPLSRVVQKLKDMGALVIQEDGCATVHLAKKKVHIPRVYRIRKDALVQAIKEDHGDVPSVSHGFSSIYYNNET
ncbi:hypothetical protein [Oscillibacter sp.]|uniref:hypothetical protein n=1 Tax=Oscillibacter sp. TaxID=1945593 RepID=UPI0028A7A01F|nr:hypothetical protein [Oscillibacter sp.]